MSINRSEIANIHPFKDILLISGDRFETVAQADKHLLAFVIEQSQLLHSFRRLIAQLVVAGSGGQVQQVMLHATHAVINRHVIVVEDNQQVVGHGRGIVEPFKSQSATHATIAYHSYHMLVFLSFELSGHSHTQSCGNGIRSMSAGKGVVNAFFWRRERTNALELAVGGKSLASASQNLMPVSLMTNVPNNQIFGRMEYIV